VGTSSARGEQPDRTEPVATKQGTALDQLRAERGLWVIIGGMVTIFASFLAALLLLDTASQIVAAMAPVTTVVGTLVGTYFGLQSGSQGQAQATQYAREASTKAATLAALAGAPGDTSRQAAWIAAAPGSEEWYSWNYGTSPEQEQMWESGEKWPWEPRGRPPSGTGESSAQEGEGEQ
jgi:hypothetical protein